MRLLQIVLAIGVVGIMLAVAYGAAHPGIDLGLAP